MAQEGPEVERGALLYIILNYYTYYIYIVLKIIKYNITRQCLE